MSELSQLAKRARFIVLYGANNLGKSTQIRFLAKRFISRGKQVLLIKYPIYELEPTGPLLNKILRHSDQLDKSYAEDEIQKIYAQNRRDFQDTLIDLLNAGITVLAEDYTGTGIAWGMTRGLSVEKLEKINEGLIEPDTAILLDGERFDSAKEKGHRNEDSGEKLWEKNRQIHLDLAKRYNWHKINANGSIEEVGEAVFKILH
jgi:thymidylate kinase